MTVQETIHEKLTRTLSPVLLAVENESHMHSVKPGSETHFKVLVVSPDFEGLGPVDRHRKVHDVLREELATRIHALTIRALTPAQWEKDGAAGFVSPACLSGSKRP